MMMNFKPNPKLQVELKFRELFGTDHDEEVRGTRQPSGLYLAEISARGEVVARAHSRDWRRAYKLLKAEVEKLYADGLALI